MRISDWSSDVCSSDLSIGGTIGRVDDIAVAIAAAVEEQNAATAEIARNVQEAADGTRNVTGSIDGVMKAASRTGSAVSQVMTAAEALSAQAATMRQQVDRKSTRLNSSH